MSFKKMSPFLILMGVAVLLFLIHKIVFYAFGIHQEHFHYSLGTLYLFFLILSVLILKILLTVQKKSFDNVGMSFLIVTSLKMVFCYLVLRPLLQLSNSSDPTEKINFFILFIVFLIIDTLFTIRLLNEKQ